MGRWRRGWAQRTCVKSAHSSVRSRAAQSIDRHGVSWGGLDGGRNTTEQPTKKTDGPTRLTAIWAASRFLFYRVRILFFVHYVYPIQSAYLITPISRTAAAVTTTTTTNTGHLHRQPSRPPPASALPGRERHPRVPTPARLDRYQSRPHDAGCHPLGHVHRIVGCYCRCCNRCCDSWPPCPSGPLLLLLLLLGLRAPLQPEGLVLPAVVLPRRRL